MVWRCRISRATLGSWLSLLTLSCLSPNKTILPADSMPASVWNNQYSCPPRACQANQKAGRRQTELRSCPAKTKWSTSGASDEVHPKWIIVRNQKKTFRFRQHPVVGQETLLHPQEEKEMGGTASVSPPTFAACPGAKTVSMPWQSDWELKAGLRFNIQCSNSLAFYSSPEWRLERLWSCFSTIKVSN